MLNDIAPLIRALTVWALPAIFAITFHEAAHGFVAHRLGDDTAWRLGRVSFNPLKHIDPFGTILLPALLLFGRAPFLFGYAKPVPVNFRALKNPRRDMIWVAAAGPAMNLVLATISAALFHLVYFMPYSAQVWAKQNLLNSIVINIILALFNMLPIPPLDGGRVAVGILPNFLALPLARLERYGMLILIGFLLILPWIGQQFGRDFNFIAQLLDTPADALFAFILQITGNS